jgi:hypothetical protein
MLYSTEFVFKSLETGETPKDWKHANVAPAFKIGEQYKPVNYRPISLTYICCKLMEHIIASSIMSHLENIEIFLAKPIIIKSVCVLQLLLFTSSCMKSMRCVSQERAFLKLCTHIN